MRRRRAVDRGTSEGARSTYVRQGQTAVLVQREVEGHPELRIELGGSAHITMRGPREQLARKFTQLRQHMARNGWAESS